MTQGFIIMLASGTFPGSMCFVYMDKQWGWSRHTERKMAHVFDSERAAMGAIGDMLKEIRYEAPELNNNLAARLVKAEVVPA